MNRTKKFFYNSVTAAFSQIAIMIAGFITPRVILRAYGSEINGLISSLAQFISYFNLVEAGLSGAAIFALYKPLADEDHKAINGVVSAAKKFYTQSGFIFVFLTLGLSFLYPLFTQSQSISKIEMFLLVLILGVNGSLEFFTLSKYRVLLSADQKTFVISLASISHLIVNTGIIYFMAQLRISIVILRLTALLSIFLRSAILMIYCRKNYPYLNYKEKCNTKALDKRWDALYQQILGSIQSGAPVIFTTVFLGLKVVSIYTIYNMVIGSINGILSIFISGLSAGFGDLIARKETRTLQKAVKEFEFAYYSILTVVYSVTMVCIMPFIKLYTSGVNDINYNVPLFGVLFVLNGLFYNIKTPQSMLIISAGMYKETRIRATVTGAIIILFGIILTPILGLPGIMLASILSNLYRTIDLLHFTPKYITKLNKTESAFSMLRVIICFLIIVFIFSFVNFPINNYMQWVMYAILAGVVSVTITGIMGYIFNRNEIKSLLKRFGL